MQIDSAPTSVTGGYFYLSIFCAGLELLLRAASGSKIRQNHNSRDAGMLQKTREKRQKAQSSPQFDSVLDNYSLSCPRKSYYVSSASGGRHPVGKHYASRARSSAFSSGANREEERCGIHGSPSSRRVREGMVSKR